MAPKESMGASPKPLDTSSRFPLCCVKDLLSGGTLLTPRPLWLRVAAPWRTRSRRVVPQNAMREEDILVRVSIFSHMSPRELKRLSKLARFQMYAPGDVIIREGERDDQLFVIDHGRVEVIKGLGKPGQRSLRTLGPLSYFGEMALIEDLIRSASVVALEHTRLLVLGQWNLRQAIEKHPAIALELLQMLSRRIRAVEKNLLKVLGGFLPICANCKRVREDDHRWIPIEQYVADRSEAEFSHGICPECAKRLYPEFYKEPGA